MLEAFKSKMGTGGSKSAKEQTDELQTLISTAREERGALSTMLTQIEVHGSKLTQVGKALQQVNDRAAGATSKLEELTTRLVALESRTRGFEQIETRIGSRKGSFTSIARPCSSCRRRPFRRRPTSKPSRRSRRRSTS
jgi:phage shock protein A